MPRVGAGARRAARNDKPSTESPQSTTGHASTTRPASPQSDAEHKPATHEIANAMVGAYKDALGRGPTKCRVYFVGSDALVVMLEDTMTAQERTLVLVGELERLREHRLVLTTALEARLRSIVESALGRRTLAFLSGFDTCRDVAMEFFTLEPASTDDRT